MKELPLPSFYRAEHAARWDYRPDHSALLTAASAHAKQYDIKPASKKNVHLLLIDVQKDFCFPEGALYVGGRSGRGAIEDNERIASFIYRNVGNLNTITTTMDTHFAFQIFFPAFWVDGKAHQEIATGDIMSGRMMPNPAMARWLCNGNYAWLVEQTRFYCQELEKAGKYKLYLWPPHCILGSDGHALSPVVHEARMFHAFTRGSQSYVEVKGGHPLTENYSVLRPEVLMRHDGQPLAQRNTAFLKTLLQSDAVVIAGQAASHCVKSTIDDLLDEIVAYDQALARKVYILTDCMSAVVVPGAVDFTDQAEAAMQRFAAAGMNLIRSTDGAFV
jgi:nicotinamidase-related amidase